MVIRTHRGLRDDRVCSNAKLNNYVFFGHKWRDRSETKIPPKDKDGTSAFVLCRYANPQVFINSPELKAQVTFSDHLSVVRRGCRFFVVIGVVVVDVNFLNFHLLLQNHWTNYNQTWHKTSFCKGNSSLLK